LVSALADGRLDLAFVSLPGHPPTTVHLRTLTSTPLDLVIPHDHRFARRNDVAITELADESFIDFPLGYGNRAVTDRAFTTAGIRRHLTIEITDIAAGTDFVRHRLGVALLPRAVIPIADDLVTLPVTGADLEWPIALATPAGRTAGATAHAFAQLVVRHLADADPAQRPIPQPHR
jgi:DNA-binding transcriptional LysR family regulator